MAPILPINMGFGAKTLFSRLGRVLTTKGFEINTPFSPSLYHIRLSSDQTMPESPHKLPVRRLMFQRISDKAIAPTRGSKCAAGYDLYSAVDCVVPKRGKQMVQTDIRVAIPSGCYGRIAPRSGLAWKHSIDVGAGVVDQDYRGNVCVILFNFSDEDFGISCGDRIAQLICEQIADTELIESQLDATERADKGFGSTGVALKESESTQNSVTL